MKCGLISVKLVFANYVPNVKCIECVHRLPGFTQVVIFSYAKKPLSPFIIILCDQEFFSSSFYSLELSNSSNRFVESKANSFCLSKNQYLENVTLWFPFRDFAVLPPRKWVFETNTSGDYHQFLRSSDSVIQWQKPSQELLLKVLINIDIQDCSPLLPSSTIFSE